jgi:uncharacterized protein (DUF302 family)
MPGFALKKTTTHTFEETLAALPMLLEAEGFGVLTRIDVKGTLKSKLGAEFRKYEILGACNPQLAHLVLSQDLEIGTLLPCNLVVYEDDGGQTVVLAVDPSATIASVNPAVAPIAAEVRRRLECVLATIP